VDSPGQEGPVTGNRNLDELVRKVRTLAHRQFNGNYKAMFDHYARKRSRRGMIDKNELTDLLKDADVGNFSTRPTWATGVLSHLDRNGDGFISFVEFQSMH
jgi:Ca2+-binding EF-hand superfamily protein